MLNAEQNTALDIAFVDARTLKRKEGPRVTMTFKVSRRAVRGLAWIADMNEAAVVGTFVGLVSAAKARAGAAH